MLALITESTLSSDGFSPRGLLVLGAKLGVSYWQKPSDTWARFGKTMRLFTIESKGLQCRLGAHLRWPFFFIRDDGSSGLAMAKIRCRLMQLNITFFVCGG